MGPVVARYQQQSSSFPVLFNSLSIVSSSEGFNSSSIAIKLKDFNSSSAYNMSEGLNSPNSPSIAIKLKDFNSLSAYNMSEVLNSPNRRTEHPHHHEGDEQPHYHEDPEQPYDPGEQWQWVDLVALFLLYLVVVVMGGREAGYYDSNGGLESVGWWMLVQYVVGQLVRS